MDRAVTALPDYEADRAPRWHTLTQVRALATDRAMQRRSTLNVSFTSELVGFVAARVASGRYGSASELVRAALRLLERHEVANDAPLSRADTVAASVAKTA